jgi:hypothetical protein
MTLVDGLRADVPNAKIAGVQADFLPLPGGPPAR